MTERYAYSGSPPVPQGTSSATSDQFPGQQRYTGAGPLNTVPAAAASAAIGYGALLQNQQQQQQQRRRRESNTLSDHTDARVQQQQQQSVDKDESSEDEIESLKRAMGSDLWALQKQRMRREQMNRPVATDSHNPTMSIQKETSPLGMVSGHGSGAAGASQRHYYPGFAQHQQLAQHQQELSPASLQLPEFANQDWKYMDSSSTGSVPARAGEGHLPSAFTSPGYMQQQQQNQHGGHRHYAGGYANGLVAVDPRQAPQQTPAYDIQVFSTAESAAYTYTSVTSPPQATPLQQYAQPHYGVHNNQYQQRPYQPPQQQQHMVYQQRQQQQQWADAGSAKSNDQMSGSVTDGSSLSQAYAAQNSQFQQRKSQSPMMEQKLPTSTQPPPPPPAQVESVTEPRYRDGYEFDSGYHRTMAHAVLSAGVAQPMREMREHRSSPSHEAQSAPSIPIQSLLNSPDQAGAGSSEDIHQHIAKENARYRQNSIASLNLVQQHATAHDSSPGSRSSYHSAAFSAWPGRAETVNLDFATAQQSLSSIDGAGHGSTSAGDGHFGNINANPLPPIPASLAPTQSKSPSASQHDSFEFKYYRSKGSADNDDHSSKPVSILVQVGDDSQDDENSGGSAADSAAEYIIPMVGRRGTLNPGRKATTESLDNVLEYYRTHPDVLDKHPGWEAPSNEPFYEESASQEQSPAAAEHPVSPFDLTSHHHAHARHPDLNSSRYPSHDAQQNPFYHRTSFSSSAINPDNPASGHPLTGVITASSSRDGSLAPNTPRTEHDHVSSSGQGTSFDNRSRESQRPDDSSLLGTFSHLHSYESTPATTPIRPRSSSSSSADSDTPLPANAGRNNLANNTGNVMSPRRWGSSNSDGLSFPQKQAVPSYCDIYAVLDELPEPDDMLLLPPAASAQRSPQFTSRDLPDDLAIDDEDVLQMESIDELGELSDILELSNQNDSSDYGYSSSNSSVDSFGAPIEHNAGILSKTLAAHGSVAEMSETGVSHLVDPFSRVSMAPTIIHQLSTSVFGVERDFGDRALSQQQQQQQISSVRAHASLLASSMELRGQHERQEQQQGEQEAASVAIYGDEAAEEEAASAATTADADADADADSGAGAAVSATDTAATAATSATIVVGAGSSANFAPLEIMEYASELEISLAREQEDYYSDNVSQANLDPMILQNLGKAVHQQCQAQRQQLLRRKSNMHLGVAATTNNGGGGSSSSEEQNGSAENPMDTHYDDHEQALKAMLIEVSQYFSQSGLNLVFPFSAKWVDWLTRHPDRPFPWRKDSEDDARGHDDDDDSGSQSDVSSFGEDPPMLSRPLPPEDVLSKATIPMSMRRPVPVKNFVSQEKRKGINAHWQYYSVINQITVVASSIHRMLMVPQDLADHSFVPHQLAALYQFLGGDFKKYKPHIESVFDAIKVSLGVRSRPPTPVAVQAPVDEGETGDGLDGDSARQIPVPARVSKLLDATYVNVLRDMMTNIITEALYSTSKVAAGKEHQPVPHTSTGATRAKTDPQNQQPPQQQQQPETGYAISTLKGLPTQSIVRYLAKEMRTANGDHRRRRGFAQNLSRNNSVGHLRHHHHQYQYQKQQPPVPPLPNQQQQQNQHSGAAGSSSFGSVSRHTPVVKHNQGVPVGPNNAVATILQPIVSVDEVTEDL